MNCEPIQFRLTALLDGELPPETAAATEQHLLGCPICAQAHADLAAVRGMTSAWKMEAPDISARVMQAVAAEDHNALLDEMRELRVEVEALRAEVSALRRQLAPRVELPWMPVRRDHSPKDYPRMENDPWNLIRS